jgi:hypothetical protein
VIIIRNNSAKYTPKPEKNKELPEKTRNSDNLDEFTPISSSIQRIMKAVTF